MKKRICTLLFLTGLGFFIFGMDYSSGVLAQSQIETVSPEITLIQEEISTPTISAADFEVSKEYTIIIDLEANHKIDPGDKIGYAILITNKGQTDLIGLTVRDSLPFQYFENIQPADISNNGIKKEDFIEWNLERVSANSTSSLNYSVTLRKPLEFGTTKIINKVTISSGGTFLAETDNSIEVFVPTLTPSPTLLPSSTPSPAITTSPISPTSTLPPPGAKTLTESPVATYSIILMALLGISVFTYVGAIARLRNQEDANNGSLAELRISIFREGVIIIFIVSAVLLMGIANTLPPDGVISILSAIVGYVFGRAATKK